MKNILLTAFCLLMGLANAQDTVATKTDSINIELLNTRLLFVAEKGDADSVLILLKQGANVNAVTYDGVSALMYATQKGHLKTVKTLVANGADVNAKPYTYDATPVLTAAVKFNHDSVAEYLIQKGANIEMEDGYNAEPLIYSVAYNYTIMTDMLLFYKAKIECRDKDWNTPLHIAAYYGYKDLVNILILRGADINAVDYSGSTPLILAAQNGYAEIVEILLKNKARTTIINNRGSTAYSTAIRNGHNEVIFQLLNYGENVNSIPHMNMKPLEFALANNQKETAEYLRENGAKMGIWPKFNTWSLGYGNEFNSKDYMYSLCLGWIDSRYKLGFDIDWATRLWPIRTLYPLEDDVFEQRRERRSILSFNISKRFDLYSSGYSSYGFALGVREAYTYGKYRGFAEKVDKQWITAPQLGLFLKGRLLFFKVNYSYLKFFEAEIPASRFTIELNFLIHKKKTSPVNKTISWL
ncbi:MAG: ankyrin repeat domain-containing protein [Bacteroidales bacterium]|nr:ankyrin repeat domain-containing protein [Bacteroidales bacterium]